MEELGLDSSPFTSRLNSNYAATDSESLEIQTLLKAPTSRLEELSTRLRELDEQYTQIKNEQTSLLISISKHRALMSVIRRLPIDILQEIFIACLPTTHNAVMSKHEPPILLTQVCSSWRNVAHATPQLWKSIHIVSPYNTPNFLPILEQVARQRSEAVLEWISRSAECPLDISLSQWENSVSDGFYDKIIDYLIRFSERWRQVSFSAPSQALLPVAALPSSKVPLLESLYLDCGRLYFTSTFPVRLDHQSIWATSGVMNAPNLREVYLTQLNEAPMRLPINWSQLTNLSLEGNSLSVSKAYEILSSCKNLVSCRLDIGIMTEYDEEPPLLESGTGFISLPSLIKFSVCECASLSRLFSLLHLPSLSSLEFHTAIWPVQESSTSLLSLLTHSHSTIQYLITDSQFFKKQDFIKCLRLCPLLKSLAIRRSHAMSSPPPWPLDLPACRLDDAFLKMFTSINSSVDNSDNHGDKVDIDLEDPGGCLCPNLEDFESSSATAFSETALLQFIKRKNGNLNLNNGEPSIPGLAKLKSVFVRFYRRPPHDITPELEPYIKAGLKATISHPPIPVAGPFSPFHGLPNTNRPTW